MKPVRPPSAADSVPGRRGGDERGIAQRGTSGGKAPVLPTERPVRIGGEERRGIGVICVGAGRGERFGGDKLAVELSGGTVLERSLAALADALPESPLVVVLPAERVSWWEPRLVRAFPGVSLVAGGPRRQDSVQLGVHVVAGTGVRSVLIHDAARPLVHRDDILRVAAALGEAPGVVLCQKIPDTVKRVDERGWVVKTLDRAELRLALTPQGFRIDRLVRAWRMVDQAVSWTDEGMLLEMAGDPVLAVEALHPNPKLTTRHDLARIRSAFGTEASP